METNIYYRNQYRKFNPQSAPKCMREVEAFVRANGGYYNICKQNGGYYVLQRDGKLRFIERVLYLLSFEEWLNESLKN